MNSQFLTETDYLCNKEMPFHSNTVEQNCHTKQSKQSKAKCSEQTETCICHTGLKTLHSKMVFLACITKKIVISAKIFVETFRINNHMHFMQMSASNYSRHPK